MDITDVKRNNQEGNGADACWKVLEGAFEVSLNLAFEAPAKKGRNNLPHDFDTCPFPRENNGISPAVDIGLHDHIKRLLSSSKWH